MPAIETFGYDPAYPRVTCQQVVIGQNNAFANTNNSAACMGVSALPGMPTVPAGKSTTVVSSAETFSYIPAGQLGAGQVFQDITWLQDMSGVTLSAGTNTVFSNPPTITRSTYAYDQLGHVQNRVLEYSLPPTGLSASSSETWTYDQIGRLIDDYNGVDEFQYSYNDATPRVTERTSAFYGGLTMGATYVPAPHDGLLQQATYKASNGSTVGQYTYSYDADYNVLSFVNASSFGTESWSYSYDSYNQLTGATASALQPITYAYDAAGNLTDNHSVTGRVLLGSGRYHFWSTTYLDTSYTPTFGDGFSTQAITNYNGTSGTTTTNATTYDPSSNGGQGNGFLTSVGPTAGYSYDALGRLVQAKTGSQVSTFSYDAVGRLVQVIDKNTSGAVVNNHTYAWCGQKRCIEFDNMNRQLLPGAQYQTGRPDRIYYEQGNVTITSSATVPVYEIKDALGSTRVVQEAVGGPVFAQYDYDPWGNRTPTAGSSAYNDGGFAGYFYHGPSALQFTANRVYASGLGRWLTRDPIGNSHAFGNDAAFNATDLNLYAYARNSPTSLVDPSGLLGFYVGDTAGYEGGLGVGTGWSAGGGLYMSDAGWGNYGTVAYAPAVVGASASLGVTFGVFFGDDPGGQSTSLNFGAGVGSFLGFSVNSSGISFTWGWGHGTSFSVSDSDTQIQGHSWWDAYGTVDDSGKDCPD
jgi:RHS repeat-associated protein